MESAGARREETRDAASGVLVADNRGLPLVGEMSVLSPGCTRLAAACSDPRGDLGTCMQTQNTSRLFKILNQMRSPASRKNSLHCYTFPAQRCPTRGQGAAWGVSSARMANASSCGAFSQKCKGGEERGDSPWM